MDDVRFVQRCCSGDPSAWDEFLQRYSRLIYNYILSAGRTYGLEIPGHDQKEIFQTIIYHLLKDRCRNLRSYQGRNGCTLASWLRLVAVRQAVTFLRGRRPVLSIDEQLFSQDDPQVIRDAPRENSADQLLHSERAAALAECIAKLTREDRYFIQLHLYAGLSVDMLKDHLRISRPAADMRKNRLLGQLRECFSSKGFITDKETDR